ncbi:YbaB/EbfC family nucleoid-associated protein [Streptomyces sp. NPDC096030]|uniref:YbaB/EbfC family nucleoid-associated protein n=1 Tax=Streptomyces sp. NPDC096030 TaxID=3155423 RepID=UPI00332148D5
MTGAAQSRLTQVLEAIEGMQRLKFELGNAQQEMASRHFVGVDAAHGVVATVNGLSGLVDLQISPTAASSAELPQKIISAVRSASISATAAYAAMLDPINAQLASIQQAVLSPGLLAEA